MAIIAMSHSGQNGRIGKADIGTISRLAADGYLNTYVYERLQFRVTTPGDLRGSRPNGRTASIHISAVPDSKR
jgi:hypothetical protein